MRWYCRICWHEWISDGLVYNRPGLPDGVCPRCRSADIRCARPTPDYNVWDLADAARTLGMGLDDA